MDIICSICQCSIGTDPPEGSTELADLFENQVNAGQEKWEVGSKVVTTPCGHLFHNSCLTQWFVIIGSRRCPLCNFISPVHKILSLYPCVIAASASIETLVVNGVLPDPNVAPSAPEQGTTDELVPVVQSSESPDTEVELMEISTPKERTDLLATETTVNGIRTLTYHFGPIRNLPIEQNQKDTSAKSLIQLSSLSKTSLASQCTRCNNLARIQALMTNDLQDLRDLIAEQKSEIESLRSRVECNKSDQETVIQV